MSADLVIWLHQVRIKRRPWRIDGVTVRAHRERCAADVADLPIQLEAAQNLTRESVRSPLLVPPERQVIDRPDLQVVRAVVARGRAVPAPVGRIGERQTTRTGACSV